MGGNYIAKYLRSPQDGLTHEFFGGVTGKGVNHSMCGDVGVEKGRRPRGCTHGWLGAEAEAGTAEPPVPHLVDRRSLIDSQLISLSLSIYIYLYLYISTCIYITYPLMKRLRKKTKLCVSEVFSEHTF